MNCYISNDYIDTEKLQLLVNSIFSYFLDNKEFNVNITITTDDVVDNFEDQYTTGITYIMNRETKDDFHIILKRNTSYKKTLTTLIHELIHVKQYYLGELKTFSDNDYLVEWKSVLYNISIDDFKNINAYNNFPWEIEANLYETYFYYLYED